MSESYIRNTITFLEDYRRYLLERIEEIHTLHGDNLVNKDGTVIAVKRLKSFSLYHQYYENGIRHREPLAIDSTEAVKLISKEYSMKCLKLFKNNLSVVNYFLDNINPCTEYDIADQFNSCKATLIPGECKTRASEVQAFYAMQSELDYHSENKLHQTKRGEYVRSKSEAMIADSLFNHGIPYVYEYPVRLNNGNIRYADFAVLHPDSMKIIYWEHLGMLGDEQYATEALRKLDIYEDNDIVAGENLILTGETVHRPLTSTKIEKIIQRNFL